MRRSGSTWSPASAARRDDECCQASSMSVQMKSVQSAAGADCFDLMLIRQVAELVLKSGWLLKSSL